MGCNNQYFGIYLNQELKLHSNFVCFVQNKKNLQNCRTWLSLVKKSFLNLRG